MKDGLLEADTVYNSFGSTIIMAWMKWESVIREQRERYNGPDWMEHFEHLADKITRIRQQRGIEFEFPETFIRYIPDR